MAAEKISAPFPPDVARYLVGSRKRTAFVERIPASSAASRRLASYWDGGSRDEWALWRDGARRAVDVMTSPPHFGGHATPYVPVAGDVLVQSGTFAGRPATPRVTIYG